MTKLPELIVLCGLPGAGKSTYARQYVQEHSETKIMSSDSIRKELYGDESIQGGSTEEICLTHPWRREKTGMASLKEGAQAES